MVDDDDFGDATVVDGLGTGVDEGSTRGRGVDVVARIVQSWATDHRLASVKGGARVANSPF